MLHYRFPLGKEIICALIDYVSNLITDSRFEDPFSGTNPAFISGTSQVPSSKQMAHSKGMMEGSEERSKRVWAKSSKANTKRQSTRPVSVRQL